MTPYAPLGWFYFYGHWGDKFYPLSDRRQYRFLGQYHYVNGPLGPRFKNLGRKGMCQGRKACAVKQSLDGEGIKEWVPVGQGQELAWAEAEAEVDLTRTSRSITLV